MSSNPSGGRQSNFSTDPVVIGLGRLLVGVGVVVLVGLLTVAWLILVGFRAI